MNITTLTENPINPRNITRDQMDKLKASIERDPEFLTLRPIIVDGEGIVLAGNQRLAALRELGRDEVPDEWVRVIPDGMEDDKVRRFILIDNSPDGISGEWDFQLLAENFGDLDLDLLGLDLDALADAIVDGEGEDDADSEPQTDRAEELRELWQTEAGQLWRIGEHRLLCGDSTKEDNVSRLLGDRKPVLMVTDPPYGVEYSAGWRDDALGGKEGGRATGKVSNDDRSDWREAWALFSGDVAYVWHAMKTQHAVATSLIESGIEIRAEIVWAKSALVISQGHYHPQHESCFYAVRKGATGHWAGDRKQTTLWQIDKPQKSETGHGTQKPLECIARPMRNHDAPEVYDPFLGSGTTMVAAQNLNRKCYGLEISPAYCAVILQRMKDAFPDIEIKKSDA